MGLTKLINNNFMKLDEKNIDIILNNVFKISHSENLCNYMQRLLKINQQYITNYNGGYLKADRYGELMEIIIDNEKDRINVLSTEWGRTNIRKVNYQRKDNCSIVTYNDDNIYDANTSLTEYKYLYNNSNELIRVSQKVMSNIQLPSGRFKYKFKETCIYPINHCVFVKRVLEDTKYNYYIGTTFKDILLLKDNVFSTINNIHCFAIEPSLYDSLRESAPIKKYKKG